MRSYDRVLGLDYTTTIDGVQLKHAKADVDMRANITAKYANVHDGVFRFFPFFILSPFLFPLVVV